MSVPRVLGTLSAIGAAVSVVAMTAAPTARSANESLRHVRALRAAYGRVGPKITSSDLLNPRWYVDKPARHRTEADQYAVVVIIDGTCEACAQTLRIMNTTIAPTVPMTVVLTNEPESADIRGRLDDVRASCSKCDITAIRERIAFKCGTGILRIPTSIVLDKANDVVALIEGVPTQGAMQRINTMVASPRGRAQRPELLREFHTESVLMIE